MKELSKQTRGIIASAVASLLTKHSKGMEECRELEKLLEEAKQKVAEAKGFDEILKAVRYRQEVAGRLRDARIRAHQVQNQ